MSWPSTEAADNQWPRRSWFPRAPINTGARVRWVTCAPSRVPGVSIRRAKVASFSSVKVAVRFYGTRGSRPVVGPDQAVFGGDTAFVVLEAGGEPVFLDLGTGMDAYARRLEAGQLVRASALLSHYHFDHVQGLPFFTAVDVEGARLRIFAPGGPDPLERLFAPPFFPVSPLGFRGEISVARVEEGRFELVASGVEVLALEVPHTNTAFGYRIEAGGISICYIPDHQAPCSLDFFDEKALRLAEGADLVIHDAQYSEVEFAAKCNWGHSTYGYAAALAYQAGAKHVVLFHHDPSRTDSDLLEVEKGLAARYAPLGLRVTAARQGGMILLSDEHAAAAGAL